MFFLFLFVPICDLLFLSSLIYPFGVHSLLLDLLLNLLLPLGIVMFCEIELAVGQSWSYSSVNVSPFSPLCISRIQLLL